MPVIKSAKKKLRQDKKRTAHNVLFEEAMKKSLKDARKAPSAETVRLATKATDKAVKFHLLHKNKAARIKSALSGLLSGKTSPKKADVKPATKANKKATVKRSLANKTVKPSKKK